MLATATLVGRAGSDPKITHFNSGSSLAEVNMAVDRYERGKEEPVTDWWTVKIWGKPAERAERYLKKGQLFAVSGELIIERWESHGNKHSKPVVVASQFKLGPKKSDQGSEQSSGRSSDRSQQRNQGQPDDDIFGGYSEDELPF